MVLKQADELPMVVAAAAQWRLAAEMGARSLGTHDLFRAATAGRDELMGCGELAAALQWLA